MKLANGKKSKLLEYLMIIVGTGLMSLAINSVLDTWFLFCKESTDRRNFSVCMAGLSAGMESCR